MPIAILPCLSGDETDRIVEQKFRFSMTMLFVRQTLMSFYIINGVTETNQ